MSLLDLGLQRTAATTIDANVMTSQRLPRPLSISAPGGPAVGFDIELEWVDATVDPVGRSRRAADALLATVPGLTEFSLDPAAIAQLVGVPVEEVWDHWYHIELHTSDSMGNALIHLSGDSGSLELSSDPPGGCQAALVALAPLLAALPSCGLRVVDQDRLLAEYEAQRSRVLRVAELVGGQTPNQALQRKTTTANGLPEH